ncbi:hypothetical protein B0H10DRAFT_2007156 [Mycena sp. CBHHK59/15]|nr:hypothetical protein B0H10DRAFT_2007156 [Mycena sp. CBHHK59/15]
MRFTATEAQSIQHLNCDYVLSRQSFLQASGLNTQYSVSSGFVHSKVPAGSLSTPLARQRMPTHLGRFHIERVTAGRTVHVLLTAALVGGSCADSLSGCVPLHADLLQLHTLYPACNPIPLLDCHPRFTSPEPNTPAMTQVKWDALGYMSASFMRMLLARAHAIGVNRATIRVAGHSLMLAHTSSEVRDELSLSLHRASPLRLCACGRRAGNARIILTSSRLGSRHSLSGRCKDDSADRLHARTDEWGQTCVLRPLLLRA